MTSLLSTLASSIPSQEKEPGQVELPPTGEELQNNLIQRGWSFTNNMTQFMKSMVYEDRVDTFIAHREGNGAIHMDKLELAGDGAGNDQLIVACLLKPLPPLEGIVIANKPTRP